ncbi:hypothetical protein QQM39_24025 [Streptomyces sp. DT2A-34]|uniref:hypothetical protein n=1 Tax=Streptomyces sp. DT2A-34 TaxID=3051182 RepID=UPI00265C803F|nr:hypothetical protein [Streptomyces sp. DT2A-34]MDO0913782.1 hypothetical protein [Streptomyces sp. DT2A-34]
MTDQPYQGYDGYDPYQQQAQPPAQQAAQQGWPGQQAYDDPQAAQQYTQQWQGQTWETQVQPPVAPAPPTSEYRGGEPSGYQAGGAGGWEGAPQGQGRRQQPHGQGQQAHAHGQQPHTQGQIRPQPQGRAHGHPQAQAYGQAPFQSPAQAQHQARAQAPGTGPDAADAQAGDGNDPGYGPATLSGDAQMTDAQRARLEGRSPIIEPGIQPAALTALLGLLLSGTAAIGSYALLVPLVALQAVTAAGWFRLNGMWPARQGIALAFAGAVTADVALLAADRAPAAILGTLGVWVLLTLVLQLRSHADPDERMYGLMATVASAALSIVAAGYLAAEGDAVTVGAVAVAVAVLVRALPLPTPVSVVVSLLAAAGAGAVVGAMAGVGADGALLGVGAAVCALIGHRVAGYDYPSRFVHFTAGVALPLAAAAPAVYLLGRALV